MQGKWFIWLFWGGILWKIIQYVKVPQEELIEKGE